MSAGHTRTRGMPPFRKWRIDMPICTPAHITRAVGAGCTVTQDSAGYVIRGTWGACLAVAELLGTGDAYRASYAQHTGGRTPDEDERAGIRITSQQAYDLLAIAGVPATP